MITMINYGISLTTSMSPDLTSQPSFVTSLFCRKQCYILKLPPPLIISNTKSAYPMNEKVLLRDCKRRIARRVASTCSFVLSQLGEGTSVSARGGYPSPSVNIPYSRYGVNACSVLLLRCGGGGGLLSTCSEFSFEQMFRGPPPLPS